MGKLREEFFYFGEDDFKSNNYILDIVIEK